jgi:hypothetical protein
MHSTIATPVTLRGPRLVVAVLAIAGMAAAGAATSPPYASKGQLLQRLEGFDNPEGALFSPDGNFVYISNAAELGMPDKGFHWTHKAGFVSKYAVQPDGTLKRVTEKLLTGLTGPLGMAASTVATSKFPVGTLFIAEAWADVAEADGSLLKDARVVDPKIIAFDSNGKVLGAIKLGAGSAAAKVSGVTATLANSLAFDRAGNLLLADTGTGVGQYEPKMTVKGGGIYLFPLASLDALAEGRNATLHYLPVPEGGPDDIEVAADGMIHFNTVGLAAGTKDPAAGGMYRISMNDLIAGKLPAPFQRGLGALDGLQFVGNNRLDTEIKDTNSIVVTPLNGRATFVLTYDKALKLSGPADIAVRQQRDGSTLMIVPELSGTTPNDGKNAVDVIRLPANF